MQLNEIKEQVEELEAFKCMKKDIGLEFKHFTVVDTQRQQTMQSGDSSLGFYIIWVDRKKISFSFEMSNKKLRELRLKKIEKSLKIKICTK